MNWEQIETNHRYDEIYRAKVKGGWMIKSVSATPNGEDRPLDSRQLTFMPDPNHEWQLGKII